MQEVLDASIAFIPETGFSVRTVSEGAQLRGISGAVTGMYPEGPVTALIDHLMEDVNARWRARIQQLASGEAVEVDAEAGAGSPRKWLDLSVPERLEIILWERLKLMAPYIKHWPEV